MSVMASSWRRRPDRRLLKIRKDNVRKDARCVEGRLRFRRSRCKALNSAQAQEETCHVSAIVDRRRAGWRGR